MPDTDKSLPDSTANGTNGIICLAITPFATMTHSEELMVPHAWLVSIKSIKLTKSV